MNIEFKAIEFPNGPRGHSVDVRQRQGRSDPARREELRPPRRPRSTGLAAAGVEFAYLCDHEMPDGTHRIITVPRQLAEGEHHASGRG